MMGPGLNRDEQAGLAKRAWHFALLTTTEPGRRNRRAPDAVFLLVAAIVVVRSEQVYIPPAGKGLELREDLLAK